MEKIKNSSLLMVFMFVFTLGVFTSCVDENELKTLPYLFRPINFNVSLNKTVATISWAKVDSAKSYRLQISTDSLYKVLVLDTTITQLSFSKELAGETTFFARIRANASDTIKNSKFNTKFTSGVYTFKTPKENIFLGYGTKNNTGLIYSAYMNDVNTLDIKWLPAANATHLILTSADGSTRDSVPLTPTDITSGEKVIGSRANSTWKVQVYNGKILRGTTYGVVEGDIIISTPGDISAAITGASAGKVVLLVGGNNYTIGNGEYKFSKNVKIRSTSPVSRSVISMTTLSGTTLPITTSAMMSVVAGSALDSLVFENIDFSGYCDNNPASTKIGYLFSNKTACTVSNIKFTNCNIHNLGNTPFRLSGGTAATPTTSQRISNLIFNGCIVNETGFSSGYALVNISKSFDYIDNITIANSTLYNFSYPVISIAQSVATTMNSVTIQNCNFNQTTQNIAASRVLFNFDFINITNGISIKNCIFGSSGSATAGLKTTNATVTSTFSGCYYCTDYIDETLVSGVSYSIKSKMTPYSGASIALWNSPATGDFKLKDTSFAGKSTAGDLRW